MSRTKDYLMSICESCLGYGAIDGVPCPDPACKAQRKTKAKPRYAKIPCPHCEQGYVYEWQEACCNGEMCCCGGMGGYERYTCPNCNGTGFYAAEDVPLSAA